MRAVHMLRTSGTISCVVKVQTIALTRDRALKESTRAA